MGATKIEWTDYTFNPWWGCTKLSAGCKNCYADRLDNRYHNDDRHWGDNSSRKPMSEAHWKKPLKWNTAAQKEGVSKKVFCASMADVFEGHPYTIKHLDRLFDLIARTPWLTWQLLTKRPENVMELVPYTWQYDWPENVWIGTSVENQEQAEKRIFHLLEIPAKVRFLSCEPLLGPIDLTFINAHKGGSWDLSMIDALMGRHYDMGRHCAPVATIQWVIAGGESGPGARPVHPDWFRSIQHQCQNAGIPFFFKQWGEWASKYTWLQSGEMSFCQLNTFQEWVNKAPTRISDGICLDSAGTQLKTGADFARARESNTFPITIMHRIGKKNAGRKLDGQCFNQFPGEK